jgi:guanidinopropionase
MDIAYRGTKAVYVTICSDVIDAAYNPGGPADFDGLNPHELFYALHQLGRKGFKGLDFVEVYPLADMNGFSAHLTVWVIIHALVGMACKKKKAMRLSSE